MIQRSISIDLVLWEAAQRKAGLTSLSAIIRELIKKWLDGEIEIK